MQIDFDNFPSGDIRKSTKIQQILDRLQKSSAHSARGKNQSINFSNFGAIEDEKSQTDKSFTSEMFNKPKEQSVKESNQPAQYEYEEEQSRDVREITYLYPQDQSFRFDRSMSFDEGQRDNSRFERLKGLLSKAKTNNLDAFYRNLQQAASDKIQGNIVFQSKTQFKQFTTHMRQQKRQQQSTFLQLAQQKKATIKKNATTIKANLFGNQAFKKKQPTNDFILPLQYSQQQYDDQEEIDFFATSNKIGEQEQRLDEYVIEKKQVYMKEAQEFFDVEGDRAKVTGNSKKPLQPIREQMHTILDVSMQQKKFQQLIHNYNNMKGNYQTLMQQLKQTSTSQYQLMEEMQKIKHDYSHQQHKLKESKEGDSDEKRMKKEEREKVKQMKEQQLATIKQEIHEIKNTTSEKDLAYVKINDKIQQLEQLVRVALQEIVEEKQSSSFTPKVINYFNSKSQLEHQRQGQTPDQELSEHANLSQSQSSMFQPQNAPHQEQRFASTSGVKRDRQSQSRLQSKHNSRITSNMQSYQGSARRQDQQRNVPYVQRNVPKQPLNFVDEFSSPLQLDLSVDYNANNTSTQSQQQLYDIAFNPPDGALQYLPLKLDQTDTKNLRSILTQKSSILFQSFEFLITVRYTMQQDEIYPIVGSLRLANKCAIDLLDVFVIVYGPQGQNVEVTPAKVFQERLKYNSNLFFQVRLDKTCIKDNGFNVQVCYKTDSITKKKINFKALLPVIQMIRPQFCYQQNFLDSWHSFRNEIYIRPTKLNFKHIRNHEDLKLVLPFIHISEQDGNTFSYGLMFRYPKSEIMFMLKIACYVNGRASVHLRADKNGDQQLKEELLNIVAFLFLK